MGQTEAKPQTSVLGLSTWRPLYMPVLRSRWCGRRSPPESLSSTSVGFRSASAERRMPRLDGDTLRFGTAIGCSPGIWAPRPRKRGTLGKMGRRAYRGSADRRLVLRRPEIRRQGPDFCPNAGALVLILGMERDAAVVQILGTPHSCGGQG